jgi:hypothetical protein
LVGRDTNELTGAVPHKWALCPVSTALADKNVLPFIVIIVNPSVSSPRVTCTIFV